MGRKQPKQRAICGILGKELTRRSRGRCEICEGRTGVRIYELAPFPPAPDPERTLMTCERCRGWLELDDFNEVDGWFLFSAVWSELPPVRLAAARMLLRCKGLEWPWRDEALEAANVDPSTGEFCGA